MTNQPQEKCRAVIFDMDGILVDSEPFWQLAEQQAFAAVGVELRPEDMARTIGLRIEEVMAFWYRRLPWNGPSTDQVAADVVARVIDLVASEGKPMPGARRAVESARTRGLPLAVASSSPRRLIDAVIDRFGFKGSFDATASAEDESLGKPHPAVFLTAAEAIGVPPTSCLVIEDSINGVVAAKAARMTCLAVPELRQRNDARFALADEVFGSLEDLDDESWSRWTV